MKIRFEPSQLAVALQAPLLCRLVDESQPRGMFGEVAVVQGSREDPLRMVLRTRARDPVAVSFDRQVLYQPERENELRQRVKELFESFQGRPS